MIVVYIFTSTNKVNKLMVSMYLIFEMPIVYGIKAKDPWSIKRLYSQYMIS